MDIAEAKERLRIPHLWQRLDLPGEPKASCKSPFREDRRASFSVSADGLLFNDFTTGQAGDAISEGAREVFRAFDNESIRLRNGQYRDIEGELGRWRENAIRLAVGQCVADDLKATALSEAQAMRAVELARWCVLSALNIMQAGRMERRLKRVREVQSRLVDYGGTQTLRELERRHGITHTEAKQLAAGFPDVGEHRCKSADVF